MRTRTLYLTVVAVFALLLGAIAGWLLSKGNIPASGPKLISGTPLYGEVRPLPDFSLLDEDAESQ
jgi:hypothetical protein